MTRGRCVIIRRLAVLAGLAGLAGGVLWAQTREPPASATPAATTQPAITPGTARPTDTAPFDPRAVGAPEDAAARAAREQLMSGLIGSKHDFTRVEQDGRNLCLPCHTPHLVGVPLPLLDQRPTTTQPLRPYEGPGVVLTGWSLLCLGCHDGVTAPDVYSSAHAVTVADQLGNSRLPARGLRSHPIGVRYPAAAEDYYSVAEVEAAGLLLPEGRIQCTTCHDAHNTHGHAGMLKISNQRSRLCLACHRL